MILGVGVAAYALVGMVAWLTIDDALPHEVRWPWRVFAVGCGILWPIEMAVAGGFVISGLVQVLREDYGQ